MLDARFHASFINDNGISRSNSDLKATYKHGPKFPKPKQIVWPLGDSDHKQRSYEKLV